MVVLGADWCPACRQFNAMLAKDKDADKLHQRVVLIEINGDTQSAKTLARKLKFTYMGYPQAFIFKSQNNELIQQFYPSAFNTVEALIANLGLQEASPKALEKPRVLGNVKSSTLELPLELNEDYGPSAFIAEPKTVAEKFVNQGVAALQVYHYVDAFRSFKMAELSDANSVLAHVGQVLAALNIDDGSASNYYTLGALQKIEAIAKNRALSPAEIAWFDFAKSYQVAKLGNYVKVPGREIKSLVESYDEVLAKDKNNFDGHSLVVWLAISGLDFSEAKKVLNNILTKSPNNVGAHHSLLHIAESENNERVATTHAVSLAALAPGSAHAQHMYGHTLPQQGRWAEALVQFKKADAIHQAWAKKYNIDVNQDWHYAHNRDLMAATYLGLGDFKNALSTWLTALEDSRALMHAVSLIVATGKYEDADKMLKVLEESGWRTYVKSYRDELELTPEKAKLMKASGVSQGHGSDFQVLVDKLIATYAEGQTEVNPALTSEVTDFFAKAFKAGGFDGWSNAYLQLLRIKRVAKILSMDKFISGLEPLEFAIRSGSLCGRSEQDKSLVRCLP